MNNYGQICTNVGVRVGDTSAIFNTEIKKYVNFRYKEIWERFNWGVVKLTYSFPTVAGTQDYQLEAGFWKPLYCYDNTNGIDIKEQSLQDIERNYAGQLSNPGNPLQYALYEKTNSSTQALERWVRLYPIPTTVITILMPYQVEPTDLSATTDLPIMECDYEVELGATAEAWRTKRQFSKALDFDNQYEEHIEHMIWRRENSPNRIVQFAPNTFPREMLY